MAQGFFQVDRNSHWIIAGAVAVVVLGGYLVYSLDANRPTVVITIPAIAPDPARIAAPPPLPLEK
jgi:hypothetical protein